MESSSVQPEADITAVAAGIKQLPPDEAMEVSLCLLTVLQVHLWRFEAAVKSGEQAQGEQAVADFMEFIRTLRDALVG